MNPELISDYKHRTTISRTFHSLSKETRTGLYRQVNPNSPPIGKYKKKKEVRLLTRLVSLVFR